MKGNVLTVERVVAAPPEVVFDILADASRHHLIDGSGMLQGANQGAPQRLALGATFGMAMKMLVPYSTVNRVVEFEDSRRIAWRTGPRAGGQVRRRQGVALRAGRRSTGAPWSGRAGTSPRTTSGSC